MNQRCVGKIQSVRDTMSEIVDGLDHLITAIEDESEEELEGALNRLPSAKAMSKSFENLGELMQTEPWDKKGKKNG